MRINKFLATCGYGSRRSVEELIKNRRVEIFDRQTKEKLKLTIGFDVDPSLHAVCVDKQEISSAQKKIFIFHKPVGIITTLSDELNRKNISSYIKKIPYNVFPIGRLDRDVSGLLLLTNDGDFAQKILHPRYQVPRTYLALVRGIVEDRAITTLKSGVMLDDGLALIKKLKLESKKLETLKVLFSEKQLVEIQRYSRQGSLLDNSTLLSLTVTEGRKHFVKRVLAAVDHPVIKLARVSFGSYKLGDLGVGELKEVNFI